MPQPVEIPVINTKKEARKQIASTLEVALAEMKNGWSEKKFKSRIKKASKVLVTGLSKKRTLPLVSKKIILGTDTDTHNTAE